MFATQATVIYADITPTTIRPGTYAISFWSNSILNTGVGTAPPSTTYTTAYSSYSLNGFARSALVQYSYGTRALAARGCIDQSDPFRSPENQLYNFCSWVQINRPAASDTWSYTSTVNTYTFGGKLAVSRSNSGQNSDGQWNKIVAGYATITSGTAGGYYYSSQVASTIKKATLSGPNAVNNNLLYPNGNAKLDRIGMSMQVDGDEEVFSIGYSNSSYFVQVVSFGSRDYFGGSDVISGFILTPTNSVDDVVSCQPPSTFRNDEIQCPAGSSVVYFGDDDILDNAGTYASPTDYNYGNIIHHRPFKVNTKNTELRQVSFQVSANPLNVIRMRLAVYSYTGHYLAYPTFTLLGQTREIKLDNIGQQVVKVNLITPVNLVYGQNYTLAFISDMAFQSPYGYFEYYPVSYSLGYSSMTANGMPTTVATNENLYSTPLGGYGCARDSQTRQFSFCASFVYAGNTRVYSGVLTVISQPYESVAGNYYQVIGGYGTSTSYSPTGTVNTVNNFTLHDMNLYTNNRLYVDPTGAVDAFGLQFVIQMPIYQAYAVQIYSFWDPASASYEYRENTQQFSSVTMARLTNFVSSFSYQPFSGTGAAPTCPLPARPANIVSPASAARVVCPNIDRAISDTYGDADVGNFELRADGQTMSGNKIYTQRFTAEGTGTVRQIAAGILNNMDQPGTILVRMGLYAVANMSLIAQTPQISLTQAIDQMIIMNLPFTVGLVAGQQYLIAIVSNAPLEIAKTAQARSPAMSFTLGASGLPDTFVSTGDDVSVSIAVFVCVASTHSFCGFYQYYVESTGSTVSLMYQGLIQADAITRTNGYGTYRPILAAGGRLTQYQRGSDSPTQATTVYTFQQRLGTTANLYTSSSNSQILDNEGLILDVSNGGRSSLVYNTSVQKMDESWRGDDKETDIVHSAFTITTLTSIDSPIPSCSLQSVPRLDPPVVPLPVCPASQNLIWYGDADNFDSAYNQEGYYLGESNHLYLRPFTTSAGKASIMSQIKFGININYNTVNKIRMGLYDKNFNFMAGTNEIRMINPNNAMFTGTLTQPQYLLPNTMYYLAMWTQHAIYSGFTAGDAPAMIVPFADAWPQKFVNTVPNSQRAVGGVGCTTDEAPPVKPDTNPGSSSSSSSDLSKGAVAGIVIGVVIATNLCLLCMFWLCCFGATRSKDVATDRSSEHSRI